MLPNTMAEMIGESQRSISVAYPTNLPSVPDNVQYTPDIHTFQASVEYDRRRSGTSTSRGCQRRFHSLGVQMYFGAQQDYWT